MDFLSDQLFDGSRIRILAIVDAFSRLSPTIDVRQRYRGVDVVDTLERVTAIHGMPKTIRPDNGPEFISRDLDLWAWSNGVTLDSSRPGKLMDNAFVESFNGKVRAECIDQKWFLSLDDARSKCESYRREYNEERPHSAAGGVHIRLVADIDTALGQQIFNLSQRQRVADIHHHRDADDLGRTVEIAEGISHPAKLWMPHLQINPFCMTTPREALWAPQFCD